MPKGRGVRSAVRAKNVVGLSGVLGISHERIARERGKIDGGQRDMSVIRYGSPPHPLHRLRRGHRACANEHLHIVQQARVFRGRQGIAVLRQTGKQAVTIVRNVVASPAGIGEHEDETTALQRNRLGCLGHERARLAR